MEIFNVNCSLNDCLSCAIKWQRVTINQSNDFNWSESGRIFSSWFETKNKKSRTERNQVELLFELINKFFTLYSKNMIFSSCRVFTSSETPFDWLHIDQRLTKVDVMCVQNELEFKTVRPWRLDCRYFSRTYPSESISMFTSSEVDWIDSIQFD